MNENIISLNSFLNEMFVDLRPVLVHPALEPAPESSFTKDADGVWTLIHRGQCLGWVNRVTGDHKYRAMSKVSCAMEQFYSLENARNYLFEQSH